MRKGITFGTFDLFHAGHSNFFASCLEDCQDIIVGLHIDPSKERTWKNKPIMSVFERYSLVQNFIYNRLNNGSLIKTEVIPYETEAELLDILKCYELDVRFIGEEYGLLDFTGKQYCIDRGIELAYIPREHSFSTTELRKRIAKAEQGK